MAFRLSKRSYERLEGVNPQLIQVLEYALVLSKIDFGIPENGGFRSASTQRGLFIQGLSKADGYDKKSAHQSGNAVDIFAYVNGKASWDEHHLSQCATAILTAASQLQLPLMWGGLWRSFVDMPHFEVAKSKSSLLK